MLSWLNSVSFRQVLKSKFTGAESKLTFDEMIRRHLKLSKQKLSLAFSLRERERGDETMTEKLLFTKKEIFRFEYFRKYPSFFCKFDHGGGLKVCYSSEFVCIMLFKTY